MCKGTRLQSGRKTLILEFNMIYCSLERRPVITLYQDVSFNMYHYFLLNNNGSCTAAKVSSESIQQLGGRIEGEGGEEGRKGEWGRDMGGTDRGPGIICNHAVVPSTLTSWLGRLFSREWVEELCETLLQKSVISWEGPWLLSEIYRSGPPRVTIGPCLKIINM